MVLMTILKCCAYKTDTMPRLTKTFDHDIRSEKTHGTQPWACEATLAWGWSHHSCVSTSLVPSPCQNWEVTSLKGPIQSPFWRNWIQMKAPHLPGKHGVCLYWFQLFYFVSFTWILWVFLLVSYMKNTFAGPSVKISLVFVWFSWSLNHGQTFI